MHTFKYLQHKTNFNAVWASFNIHLDKIKLTSNSTPMKTMSALEKTILNLLASPLS